MNDLRSLILSAIRNPDSQAWFPDLTEDLVSYGWKELYEKYGLQVDNYSTEALLKGGAIHAISDAAISLKPAAKTLLLPIHVYPMPDEIASMYADAGAKPYSPEILQNSTVLQCLQESLEILSAIPTVYETVSRLVACLHILKPEDDDFDISYSLPNIPFSIFVSIPSKRMDNDALRVAEAILHEAMHLQLTLIEQIVSMVVETDEKYFSPWKNEHRHRRGVLHAIYVFCVIKQFFELLVKQNIPEGSSQYSVARCAAISSQLMEVSGLINCQYLTGEGVSLATHMFYL